MDGGLPMLNCLLQHTLRSICSCSSDPSDSSKWVYAVFWRILPRNYPPPKWEFGGGAIDRTKGNKRNWILVWEDGFCDFCECEKVGGGYTKGRFGPEVFFKMSHEVYSYGEGLVGKVAADNSHRWVWRDAGESDPNFISSGNMSIEPQPKAWEVQFNTGIQTIAIISVREGIVQLGSLDQIAEDLNLVISIQRKFSYLQSIPGVFAIQRPYLPFQDPYLRKSHISITEHHETFYLEDEKCQFIGAKRLFEEAPDSWPVKSINLGWNTPQYGVQGPSMWPIPPLLSKLPPMIPAYNPIEPPDPAISDRNSIGNGCQTAKTHENQVQIGDVKVEPSCHLDAISEEKPTSPNCEFNVKDQVLVGLGFEHVRDGEQSPNLN
ncbi:uncharacterized protein LOC115747911 [Rhodamnia argentea]|uniref:Uncharacterized protein LOC115747911 n=1 Tax=Rhodamnia argentea TaxID=178133 RepID=A0ABM3GZN5_9MYRT|nr:uncharacterized protein LOC115747911 [Rhodamnia argentea]